MGESRTIKPIEPYGISDCIRKFWGDREDDPIGPETRDQSYEQCLSACQVCGSIDHESHGEALRVDNRRDLTIAVA